MNLKEEIDNHILHNLKQYNRFATRLDTDSKIITDEIYALIRKKINKELKEIRKLQKTSELESRSESSLREGQIDMLMQVRDWFK